LPDPRTLVAALFLLAVLIIALYKRGTTQAEARFGSWTLRLGNKPEKPLAKQICRKNAASSKMATPSRMRSAATLDLLAS
jgi:hypothetical protein